MGHEPGGSFVEFFVSSGCFVTSPTFHYQEFKLSPTLGQYKYNGIYPHIFQVA